MAHHQQQQQQAQEGQGQGQQPVEQPVEEQAGAPAGDGGSNDAGTQEEAAGEPLLRRERDEALQRADAAEAGACGLYRRAWPQQRGGRSGKGDWQPHRW